VIACTTQLAFYCMKIIKLFVNVCVAPAMMLSHKEIALLLMVVFLLFLLYIRFVHEISSSFIKSNGQEEIDDSVDVDTAYAEAVRQLGLVSENLERRCAFMLLLPLC
jgi:hypothetical protein